MPNSYTLLQLIKIFSLSLGICCFLACEEPVTLDLVEVAPQIVVNGTFTPNHPFQIILSKNKSVLSNEATDYIPNAKVRILNEQGILLQELPYMTNMPIPYYGLAGFQPKEEALYQLEIELPAYKTIYASGRAPEVVPLESIQLTDLNGSEEEALYTINITSSFTDPEATDNYYHLQLYYQVTSSRSTTNGLVNNQPESFVPITSLETQAGNPAVIFDTHQNGVLFTDEEFQGQQATLSFLALLDKEHTGNYPQIIGELRTISKAYYLYYTSLTRQLDNKDRPFAEPVPVFNNIENGLGIFAGFNHHRDSIIVAR